MKGTTPEGARSEQEAATWVRGMFGRVAHRYDLANHLLSFNIDKLWRARTVRRVRPVLERPGARVLDICCGTGDLVMALQRVCPRPVLGSDFCHPMLVAAREKVARQHAPSLLFESDALRLPVRDASLDLITVAFGFRNLANYEDGLREMRRVLRPGGRAYVLEFSHPVAWLAPAYFWYMREIMPKYSRLFTPEEGAYRYLGESIKAFLPQPKLAALMLEAGFSKASWTNFALGIVALHIAEV